ncbi:TRAP transporter substrate-binding protein [Rhodospirillaceae bacterium SYSU D60014]|uniref:TRAP transporter substrate-binding protein n=1 Tax=Virgifigura deserti TaxID=2268457 RepID=UPI000E669EB7
MNLTAARNALLGAALVAASAALPGVSHAQEEMMLTFAHGFTPDMSWGKAAQKFKEVVERETDGKLQIQIYDSALLGEQRQLIEQIIDTGTNDISISLEPISLWVPEVNLYQLLYLFEDMDHLIRFEEGEGGQALKDLVREKAGLEVLTYFPRAPRQLSTVDIAVDSVEDVQGMKLRVPESKSAIAGWTAIGAKPVPMPFGEVFTALRQGVLDAQENPFPHMVARKTYEVTPHGARTNHVFAPVWLFMSAEKYAALPPEYKAAIDKAAQEAHAFERKITEAEIAEAEATLKENGFQITEPDLAPFREAARRSYDQFPQLKGWIERVQAIE